MMDPLLKVESLSKQFGSLQALDDISFRLAEGEVLGLVGRRGVGKTSLLRILAGVIPPSAGSVTIAGKKMTVFSPRQARQMGIELIHPSPHLTDHQLVLDNIFLGREICWPTRYGVPQWSKMYERASELLADFNLPASLLTQKPASLADEQRQVIAIARGLCNPPRLLLLDDCLASLSYARQQTVLNWVERLAGQGAGAIISSDNLKHLFQVTQRILVLYEGHVIASRRTAECTPRDIVELIVGTSDREQTTPMVWALESFHAAQRQTEELFRAQAALHQSLEASDSLNRQLIQRLSEQVRALDTLNTALQETQRRLLNQGEEERKALARELHDEVIQDLLSLNYRLEEMQNDLQTAPIRAEMEDVRTGVRQLVSDLRQLCQDLRPPTIDNHGLSSALRSLTQEWSERSGIRVDLEIDPQMGRIPEVIELTVFRIVQEGLNNVRKHASARRVSLRLRRTPMDNLLIRLEDDGSGIPMPPDFASLSASKHYGLVGISERAALFGGKMEIDTPPDGGLILQVEIPSPYPSY